jgi:hypothetical protein
MLLAFLRDAQAAVTLVTMWMWMSMSDRRRPGSSTPLQRGVSDHVLWPQAWQTKRPFRVVAHATGLLLASARAVARPGGRHGPPPDDDGL